MEETAAREVVCGAVEDEGQREALRAYKEERRREKRHAAMLVLSGRGGKRPGSLPGACSLAYV